MKRLLFAAVILSISFLFNSCDLISPNKYQYKASLTIQSTTKDIVAYTPSGKFVGDSLEENTYGNKEKYKYRSYLKTVVHKDDVHEPVFKGKKWIVEFVKDSTSTEQDSLNAGIFIESPEKHSSAWTKRYNSHLKFPEHSKIIITFSGMWPDPDEADFTTIKE